MKTLFTIIFLLITSSAMASNGSPELKKREVSKIYIYKHAIVKRALEFRITNDIKNC